MLVWKMIFLFQGCILRFHVNLAGRTQNDTIFEAGDAFLQRTPMFGYLFILIRVCRPPRKSHGFFHQKKTVGDFDLFLGQKKTCFCEMLLSLEVVSTILKKGGSFWFMIKHLLQKNGG